MVLAVYRATARPGVAGRHARPRSTRIPLLDHASRTSSPATGLSRYYDRGDGPGARGPRRREATREGRTHYDRVRELLPRPPDGRPTTTSPYYDRSADELTPLFYKGDRSMRESGFDPVGPLRPVQRRRHPLRAGVPEHAALPDGDWTRRRDRRSSGDATAAAHAGARARSAAARPSNRCCGTRRPGSTSTTTSRRDSRAAVPVRDDVLPAVGRARVAGAGAPRARRTCALFERAGRARSPARA